MATSFPTGLDALANPAAGDYLSSPSHADQHINANDSIEAIETKIGINTSAVTASLDYRIAQLEERLSSTVLVPFTVSGALSVATGALRFIVPAKMTIRSAWAAVNTAPTGSSLIIDVNKNGTSIFTTQANRPTIIAGAFSYTSAASPDITALGAGDYITVDVDQIGSTIAGSNLSVSLYVIVNR